MLKIYFLLNLQREYFLLNGVEGSNVVATRYLVWYIDRTEVLNIV